MDESLEESGEGGRNRSGLERVIDFDAGTVVCVSLFTIFLEREG